MLLEFFCNSSFLLEFLKMSSRIPQDFFQNPSRFLLQFLKISSLISQDFIQNSERFLQRFFCISSRILLEFFKLFSRVPPGIIKFPIRFIKLFWTKTRFFYDLYLQDSHFQETYFQDSYDSFSKIHVSAIQSFWINFARLIFQDLFFKASFS